MLNIPSRRPDFNKTFPTHQDFEATKNNIALAKSRNTPLRWLTLSSRSRDDACLAGKSKIVPSAAGRIEQILFVIPKGGDYDRRLKRHFTNLVRHLEGKDENRNYIVVCKPEQKRHLHGWFTEYGVSDSNISFVSSPHFNVTLWAQDAYVAVGINDQPLPILHEGVSFARAEDMSIADDIAAQELVMATQSYFSQRHRKALPMSLTEPCLRYLLTNFWRFLGETSANYLIFVGIDLKLSVLPSGESLFRKLDCE